MGTQMTAGAGQLAVTGKGGSPRSAVASLALLSCLLTACSGDGGQSSLDASPAERFGYDGEDCATPERPLLSECSFNSRYVAECGGEGEERFACTEEGDDCRWLVGGCVPAELVAVSRCPADDICCEERENGGTGAPFLQEDFEDRFPGWIFDLEGLGTLPWDRAREMNLTITEVDSVVDDPLTCDEGTGPSIGGPCQVPPGPNGQVFAQDLLTVLGGSTAKGTWTPRIEIDEALGTARFCQHSQSDAIPSSCRPLAAPPCAESGSLRYTKEFDGEFLAGVKINVDLTFQGVRVTGTLSAQVR